MKKIVIVCSLVSALVTLPQAWANECQPEELIQETAEKICNVHSADGVVDCIDI